MPPSISEEMQRDWNARAEEDANFYVAFGRRDQDPEEFFETAKEVVAGLLWEMKRGLPAPRTRARRALEIGCGPGRLLRPMSRHFGEIHGVDVSDRMILRARENLRGIAHAHAHHGSGADLGAFADESFDFVYSYAVFQHIPSRDVVFSYLREALRVMKPGAILRAQLNGLPQTQRYDTWSGVRIDAAEICRFTREQNVQLLSLEGVQTQYMWTTWRKTPPATETPAQVASRIRRITNAHSSEPVAPTRGRFASITLWVEALPCDADLNTLQVLVGDRTGRITYIGPREADGLQQVNVILPQGCASGLAPVEFRFLGTKLGAPRLLRLLRPAPVVPRIVSITDGINLLSATTITSGSVKIVLEEAEEIEALKATLNGIPVKLDTFTADPMPPRHEVNFLLPPGTPAGPAILDLQLGRRKFPPVSLEVVLEGTTAG